MIRSQTGFPRAKRVIATTSHNKPLENGAIEVSSGCGSSPAQDINISFLTQQDNSERTLSTQGCLLGSKNLILAGKSITSNTVFPITESSPISDLASTSSDQAFSPFWTHVSQDLSKKLWLPIATSSPESVTGFWNTSFKREEQFSQSLKIMFATDAQKNCTKTSWQCLPTSKPNTTEKDHTRVKSVKLRIYPTPEQKHAFRQYAGTHRYLWNQAKSLSNKVYDEARAVSIAELEGRFENGCLHDLKPVACSSKTSKKPCKHHDVTDGCVTKKDAEQGISRCHFVQPSTQCGVGTDPEAHVGSKARYFCGDHVPKTLPGVNAKITTRCRPLEKLETASVSGMCQHKDCLEVVEGGVIATAERYYCGIHADEHRGNLPKIPQPSSIWSFITLRNALLPPNEELEPEREWLKDVPYNTRQLAIKKYADAVTSFFKLRLVNPRAEMPRYLAKKAKTSVFHIDANSVAFKDGILRLCPTTLSGAVRCSKGKIVKGSVRASIRDRVRFAKEVKKSDGKPHDAIVQCDEFGRWYFIQPISFSDNSEVSDKPFGDIYFDPGVRTGLTGYCPDGVVLKIGDNLMETMKHKLFKADSCMSAAQILANKGGKAGLVKRIRRRAAALRTKVRSVVQDCHKKTCRFLCDNFTTIFLPVLNTEALTKVSGRNINNETVRKMLTFAHGAFRERLKDYASTRGVQVLHPSEAWTTKTCTVCGTINEVGGAHVISCPTCSTTMDRDVAGSRNIALRCLTPSLGS